MSIYTKSKTTVSNLNTVDGFDNEDSFRVGIAQGAENLIIDYLTNLYSNPATAVVRELFTNACDATGQSEDGNISIKLTESDNEEYTFSIMDFGCGMSAKELKENYVTYASSTKTSDFNSVGSFGLGSKSPMAIVPSYTVESCNGKEHNKCVVARTKNGVFGKIENLAKEDGTVINMRFTKVSFSGVSKYHATKMDSYIRNIIVPFSNIKVSYDSEFLSSDGLENLKNREYNCVVKIPHETRNITLYTNNPKDFYYLINGKKFNHRVRINNITYPVYNSNVADGQTATMVIDVEPGFFAFNPSREELPAGSKLDYIKSIFDGKLFENYEDVIRFIIDNGVFSASECYEYENRRNFFKSINDFSCFKGVSATKIKIAEDIAKWHSKDAIYEKLNEVEGIHVVSYTNRNSYKKTSVKEEHELGFIADVFKACTRMRSEKLRVDTLDTIKTFVVEGVKKGKKSGIINIPVQYRLRNVSEEMYHDSSSYLRYVYLFVEDGAKVPAFLKRGLEYCGISDYEFIPAEYLKADYDKPKSANGRTPRARVSAEDRDIRCLNIIENCEYKHAKLSEFESVFGGKDETIVAYDRTINGDSFTIKFVEAITGKKVVIIDDMAKCTRKHLDNIGYTIFQAKANKRNLYVSWPKTESIDYYYPEICSEDFKSFFNTVFDRGYGDCAAIIGGKFVIEPKINIVTNLSTMDKLKIRYSADSEWANKIDEMKDYLKSEFDYNDITTCDIDDAELKKLFVKRYGFDSQRFNCANIATLVDANKIIAANEAEFVKYGIDNIVMFGDRNYSFFNELGITRLNTSKADEIIKFFNSNKFNDEVSKFVNSNETVKEFRDTLRDFKAESTIVKYGAIYPKLDEDDELDKLVKAKVDEVVAEYADKFKKFFS